MARLLLAMAAVVLLPGCGSTSGLRPSTSPSTLPSSASSGTSPSPWSGTSPTPASTTPSAVVMLGPYGNSPPGKYFLYVIGADGRILRSATGSVPSAGSHLPTFSVAGRSIYFIDGDRDLKVLRVDGSVALVGLLPGGPADRVVFAVSPDEQQIAYSVLHYGPPACSPNQPCQYPPTTTSLRVGRLDGTAVREIFASASVVEYPIGWLNGRLLMSITRYAYIQNPGEVNPYFADEYHIVDAQTATRSFDSGGICDERSSLTGPVNAAGTVCIQNSGNTQIIAAVAWSGQVTELSRNPGDGYSNVLAPVVLAPDGRSAAANTADEHRINILSSGQARPTPVLGTPAGWLDADHLLFMTPASGACCTMLTSAAVLNLTNNSVTRVKGLVGSADPYAPFFVNIPNSLA